VEEPTWEAQALKFTMCDVTKPKFWWGFPAQGNLHEFKRTLIRPATRAIESINDKIILMLANWMQTVKKNTTRIFNATPLII